MLKRESRSQPQVPVREAIPDDHSSDLWNPQLTDVRRRLLTSAVRCFAVSGYHGTTTRTISSGVGLSPAALYVHFPSKESLLFEIIRAGHERALEHLRDPTPCPADDPAEELRVLVGRYTAWHARHHIAARVCQYQYSALSPEHYERIKKLRHQTNDVFRQAISRLAENEVSSPIDVNRAARAMMSLSIDVVRWYRLDGRDSPEQLGQFYADLALTMVLQRPPSDTLAR